MLPKKEETLPNLLYEASITLIPKSDKDISRLQANIPNEHRYKNSQ